MTNLPDTKKWIIGTTIVLMIDEYELVLMGLKETQSGLTKFSGEVNFFNNPISIKYFANRFLSNFDLKLPSNVPDITFNSFGGATVLSPKKQKYYRFYANSKLTLRNPFGLSHNALNFDNLKLALNRVVKIVPPPINGVTNPPVQEQWDTSLSVISDISYTPSGTNTGPISFGSGNFYFVSGGNYALSLFITQEINPAEIIKNLLSITIPSEIKTFLPVFTPEAADKPIRLYKSSADFTFQDVEENGSLSPVHFRNGFNLDQLNIEILNTHFLIAMSIVNDTFCITAHSENINLFGLIEVIKQSSDTSYAIGPGLTVKSKTEEIKLFGGIKFFPDAETPVILDFEFSYFNTVSEFQGDIVYQGTIAGEHNPEIGFAWKKSGGFRITKFPFDQKALSEAMDWGEKIKKFANASLTPCILAKDCEELVNLAFNEIITTSFDIKFSPGASDKTGYVKILASGTYKISAVGKSVSNIEFSPLEFKIKIPKSFDDMAQAIVESLIASSETIAESLWNNKAQLTEFFTFITIKNVTKTQACRLACKVGEEVLKKAFEDLIKTVVADSLATAAEAVAGALGVLAAIASAISWLVSALTGRKSEAEKQRDENTNKIQNELLKINNMSASYHQAIGNDKYINVNWDDIPGREAGNGRVYYVLSWQNPGGILQSRTINRNKIGSPYTEKISKPLFKNGVAVRVTVTAHFDYNGQSYKSGNPGRATVNTPILQTPLPIPKNIDLKILWTTIEQKKIGIIKTRWNEVYVTPPMFLSPVTCSKYIVTLYNITAQKIIQQETIVPGAGVPLEVAFHLYKDTTPVTPLNQRYMPNPIHLFQIKINAIATDSDLNSLTGTSDPFRIPRGIGYVRLGYNFKIN